MCEFKKTHKRTDSVPESLLSSELFRAFCLALFNIIRSCAHTRKRHATVMKPHTRKQTDKRKSVPMKTANTERETV
jgi:hypothetical protein